jgi:hypothetical protein
VELIKELSRNDTSNSRQHGFACIANVIFVLENLDLVFMTGLVKSEFPVV